ncbi:hypothetical protein CGLAR1_14220 [Corynebacterium glutamicum]|uniref:hypothetical protein n=1 Tax=Corynebacterium glutamicum TaxID=1718 RepID=UPI0004F91583|nr:hypothetical protein [Corynebacterium glutamicum]AIK86342.1 hypothetical protein CGLAR1_14220 [Corynebacterium glutamicum]AIK89125.1 hypothetical protein AR0_14360 [Corynebacterium glutamicum]
MEQGNFTVEDLAARFVYLEDVLSHGDSNKEKRLRFDKKKFEPVIPQGLNNWYETAETAFEEDSPSWENRKKFAASQLRNRT